MKLFPSLTLPLLASSQSLGEGTTFTMSAAGRGCLDKSSVSASMSRDGQRMTVTLHELNAYTGPGYAVSDKTQNCGLHLVFQPPNNNTQFALVENTYHGYTRLEPNITLALYSTFYPSYDASASTTTSISIEGSGAGQVFTRSVVVPESQYKWSRCGGPQGIWNLNERASLTSRVRDAEGRYGAEEGGPLTRQVRFIYRECS
ncbi:hypothetical protein QBC40DRAFT_341589 [Triangularia verruculosa]|uniref:Uncharacterized protein n=1 Tax=Triangularia verruculosa TaxID=2587418 RepID=A0AAN6XCG0_9PEZI|nr:hypothetical protein QBC40DRAFT_341589 [Triangularia verruculosa]